MTAESPYEHARLRALDSYHLLDTPPDEAYDDLARIAATICGTPIALITLVDRDRQWFKSRGYSGGPGGAGREAAASVARCRRGL